MHRTLLFATTLIAGLVLVVPCRGAETTTAKIPILYSTDLFHPHDDPDDHYDLATLFAMPEFHIRGIILDLGAKQKQKTGRPAVEQMMRITGRKVPCAIGLARPLRSRTDKGLDQSAEFQGGVELILKVLRESPEKVTIFTTGSCRDVAAAANREPDLVKAKVRAYYANVGNGPAGPQKEYNVGIDQEAYARIFEAGVPLYWCPCYGKDGYQTHFNVNQSTVIGACSPAVQNFFVYCLTRAKDDPLAFLATAPHPVPGGGRSMWCTAPMFHAAGRRIYQRGPSEFVALQPAEAEKAGASEIKVFEFVPLRAAVDPERKDGDLHVTSELNPPQSTAFVFRVTDSRFGAVMDSCLKNCLAPLGR